MQGGTSSRRRRRLWVFAGAEFDEASWSLRVNGRPIALEGKPLEVLHELLLRAGEVVTKDEILDAVWPGVTVVEGSLATAISKLRKAWGTREDTVIETVPRVGYRLSCPVELKAIDSPLAPRFTFGPGDTVPGRSQWQLENALGDSGAEDVWCAHHVKTGERRVFKFADAPDRLRALKREAALSRIVFAGLGDRAPVPALFEWNFEAAPYFLEYAYGGSDLIAWADEAGGLAAIALEKRLAIAADICRAVADIHDLGVLHKDLKPANILVAQTQATETIRLADFGSGRLLDDSALDRLRITDPGSLGADLGKEEPRSGTPAYRAPELTGSAMPTVKSDIYALGLILYQLVVGDFTRSLAPGWEEDVLDPLLREDLRLAAAGTPDRRLGSARELAERITQLDRRRHDAARETEREAFLAEQARLEERRRMRRPWIRAAIASLGVGLAASMIFAIYALSQRNDAIAARELADTGFSFIAEDILASPDPARSSADETVLDAIKRASRSIGERFAGTPHIAARLHLAIARAFHQRSDFDTARAEYARAQELFAQAGEEDGDDAILGRLNRIHMEATSGQPERLEEAGRLIGQKQERLGIRAESGRIGFALASAEGAYAYTADIARAERAFRRAVEIGEATGEEEVPPTQVLKARSSLALTLMRLGRAQEAEPIARAIIEDSVRVRGRDHPDTLVTRQHWLNNLSMLGRHEEALRGSAPLLTAMRARFGDNHRFTLALHSVRFESHAALGQYDDAAREAEVVWRGAAAQAGPQSHQALVGQIDHASALCRTARPARGLPIAQQAFVSARSAFGPDYPLTHVIGYYVTECLIANGRHAEAAPILQALDRQKMADLTGQANIGAVIDLAAAQVALALRQPAAARRLFGAALPVLRDTEDRFTRDRIEAMRRALALS